MEKLKIYLASSWRNPYQPEAVQRLRALGHEVYDFRNPPHGRGGFQWSRIGEDWLSWSTETYRRNLAHPYAEQGFKADFDAMSQCDTCVLLLPCGRSAHTEAGWFSGAGRKVYVVSPEQQEPELMYKLFDGIFTDIDELCSFLSSGLNPNRFLN